MILWLVDSAAALNCNVYVLEAWLVGHLDKPLYIGEGAQYVNVRSSVHWEGVYSVGKCSLEVQDFLNHE